MVGQRFAFGPFVYDAARSTLLCERTPIAAGQRGLAVLHALLKANGEVVTKAELMEAAWPGTVVEESNLSVQIAALRKLLGRADEGTEWIATVPRVGYRFTAAILREDPPRQPKAPEPAETERRPSLAVLPFANLSGDAEQEYLADGVTEEIIAALSRCRWFFVIARNSSFAFKGKAIDVKDIARELDVRYVLEGSLRKSGRQVRIAAELIDAQSAHQLWAQRYDVELDDVFAVQDRIAEQVAGAIEPELLRTESALAAKRRRAGNANAWDLVYQGTWFFHRVTRDTHHRARELFRQARELDPEIVEASCWLARVSAGMVAYGWSDDAERDLHEGSEAALAAVQMDEKNPYAHYALAIISVYYGPLDQAVRAAEKALELSPSFALGYLVLGMARLFAGSPLEATQPLERGLRLNPYDPQNFVWYNVLALAYLFSGDARKARENAVRALKVRPNWRPTLETLACCDVLLGDLHAARQCAEQLATLEEAAGDVFGPLRRLNPQWAEQITALLRKARAQLAASGG
jgi:TolB-like protein